MDNNNYLQVLSSDALLDRSFHEEEVQEIQLALWQLLGERTERFTMGDSSSVPIETAEELLRSICFSIGLHLQKSGDFTALKTQRMEDLLKASWQTLEDEIAEGKKLFHTMERTAPAIENRSYADTQNGIALFFRRYDYRFFAHDIPADIDYQLCIPVSEDLLGITYINAYLKRLVLENRFCNYFETSTVTLLLQSYCPDYKELLINLFAPIATNAIGLALLGQNVLPLAITDTDRITLRSLFKDRTPPEAHLLLHRAAEEICRQLEITEGDLCNYLQCVASGLYPRIKSALDALDGIFLSLYPMQPPCEPASQYVDGEPMENQKLQALIREIQDCRFVGDKITIVKRETHSLRDLVEVLNLCFWGDECDQLFAKFSETELDLLRLYVKEQSEDWQSESGWETHLCKSCSA